MGKFIETEDGDWINSDHIVRVWRKSKDSTILVDSQGESHVCNRHISDVISRIDFIAPATPGSTAVVVWMNVMVRSDLLAPIFTRQNCQL